MLGIWADLQQQPLSERPFQKVEIPELPELVRDGAVFSVLDDFSLRRQVGVSRHQRVVIHVAVQFPEDARVFAAV